MRRDDSARVTDRPTAVPFSSCLSSLEQLFEFFCAGNWLPIGSASTRRAKRTGTVAAHVRHLHQTVTYPLRSSRGRVGVPRSSRGVQRSKATWSVVDVGLSVCHTNWITVADDTVPEILYEWFSSRGGSAHRVAEEPPRRTERHGNPPAYIPCRAFHQIARQEIERPTGRFRDVPRDGS